MSETRKVCWRLDSSLLFSVSTSLSLGLKSKGVFVFSHALSLLSLSISFGVKEEATGRTLFFNKKEKKE